MPFMPTSWVAGRWLNTHVGAVVPAPPISTTTSVTTTYEVYTWSSSTPVAAWYSGNTATPIEYQVTSMLSGADLPPSRADRRRVARTRARSLLVAHLDVDNQRRLDTDRCIEITGSDGHRYRIEGHDFAGNVVRLDDNGAMHSRWCAHPSDESMPVEDHMLAQMLHLLTDADRFIEVANRHA